MMRKKDLMTELGDVGLVPGVGVDSTDVQKAASTPNQKVDTKSHAIGD